MSLAQTHAHACAHTHTHAHIDTCTHMQIHIPMHTKRIWFTGMHMYEIHILMHTDMHIDRHGI